MEIIGLSGYARVGKDEAAKVLVEEFGFTRVAFADKLREFLYALNPPALRIPVHENPAVPVWLPLQIVIDEYGWDGYKETPYGPHVRQMLQRLGTEAGRQTLWDSIWIDAAFANTTGSGRIVVTDVRFPNEAQAIKERGGKVWRITRQGVGPANSHPSETSLDDWKFDAWIDNNGTLTEYFMAVRNAHKWTLGDKNA